MSDFRINCFKAVQYVGYLFIFMLWAVAARAEVVEDIDGQLTGAAEKGNLPMVKRILEATHVLSPETINAALFAGVRKGSRPIVQLLLDRGGDANYREIAVIPS